MIILAHDGSIYSDWVARYALCFAAHEDDRKLLVLHVDDESCSEQVVDAKLAGLEKECQRHGVQFSAQMLPLGASVYRSLRQAIPRDPEALLVCGTRYRLKKKNLLRGSLAEKLLRMHQCPVLAIRVVQPGRLGNPRELLLPLAGHLDGYLRLWPILRRFVPAIKLVHLFRVLPLNYLRHLHLTFAREQKLREIGMAHLNQVAADLDEQLGQRHFSLEKRVVISEDWVQAVVVRASRLKSQLILIGVSERSLAHRILRGSGVEKLLRQAPCDVGIYRGL